MSAVVFYEKPGCLTNNRQKALLERHGCQLVVRDLLSESWTEARLYPFLERRPVAEWFNPAAPNIRNGEIDPEAQTVRSAMALLLQEPLLIRRPLLDTAFGKRAGFDDHELLAALGIPAEALQADYWSCSKPADADPCPASR